MYLGVFAKTSDLAISLRTGRHAVSVGSETDSKKNAMEWNYDQVRTGVRAPQRFHRDSAGAITLFSPDSSIALAIAAYPSTLYPPWSRNYLKCGMFSRVGTSPLTDGAWIRPTLNVGSITWRFGGILIARARAFGPGSSQAPYGDACGYPR